MRIICPLCGERDLREFYCQGAATALERPAVDSGEKAWDDYLHIRENLAGEIRELWFHQAGCSAWLVVTRDSCTHAVLSTDLAATVKEEMT